MRMGSVSVPSVTAGINACKVESVPFNLRETVGQSLEPLQVLARGKSLRLEFTPAPDLPARVNSDPVRIRQIVVNLVGNAIKFTHQGEITVMLERGPQAGDRFELVISVRDTGIGIPAAKQQAIFDAFSQADTSTTREYGGTGLGLTICARLAALMGGGITVSSQPGAGSTFRATLQVGAAPEVDDAVAPESAAQQAAAPDTGQEPAVARHVLIAEDNPVNQAIAEAMLASLGYRVSVANNGREAVEQAQTTPFDAILMDVQMPELSGLEATRAIRSRERATGARVPIIALTANAMRGDREECIAAGMDAYLTKPFDVQALTQELQRLARAS